jgi:hypothetical protein
MSHIEVAVARTRFLCTKSQNFEYAQCVMYRNVAKYAVPCGIQKRDSIARVALSLKAARIAN